MEKPMTFEEMEAAGQRAARIKLARQRLIAAQEKLALLRQFREPGKRGWEDGWTPTLTLRKGNANYGLDVIQVEVFLPYPIVEQQLVDAINAAHRELVLLGGMP